MNEEEKKLIEIFINKCEKYDESVEVKEVSVGKESRILDTVVKYLKIVEKQQKEIEEKRTIIMAGAEKVKSLEKEIEKKDKVIDEMAKKLVEDSEWFYSEFDNYTKEEFIQYFYRKVESDGNEVE